jgi:hypothetical protein
MGWFGYGIYDGDGTSSCHYDYIEWAGIEKDFELIGEMMSLRGTKVPEDKKHLLRKNAKDILKHLKTPKFWNEDNALDWQMLLALYVDNDIKPLKLIYENGMTATEYLMGEHASDFDKPATRRKRLKAFMEKAERLYRGAK